MRGLIVSSSASGASLPFAHEEAPRLHQRTDRDVERAVGVAAVAHRLGDQIEQLLIDDDRPLRSFEVDLRELAVRLVVAHQLVDAIDFVESLRDEIGNLRSVGPVGHHREHRSHHHAAFFVPHVRASARSQPGGSQKYEGYQKEDRPERGISSPPWYTDPAPTVESATVWYFCSAHGPPGSYVFVF